MKIKRILVRVFAIILGVFYGVFCISGVAPQAAIKEPVNEEYYEMLQENAINVARTLDVSVVTDEKLTADFCFNKDELLVTVESFKAKVVAHIPISKHTFSIEEGSIKSYITPEYEEVEYEKENKLMPAWWYIFMVVAMSIFVAVAVWFVFEKVLFYKREDVTSLVMEEG